MPPFRSASRYTQLTINPVGGINTADAPTDIDPSQSPSCDNFIFRYNAMEPRPSLVGKTGNERPGTFGSPLLGGADITDTAGNHYPFGSFRTNCAWYSNGSWSVLSYVSAYGHNTPPAAGVADYWDITNTYFDLRDENIAILANNSYQTLYCWQSNTTVFSTLTGAPMARCVDTFDNYILAGNVQVGSSTFVQRVQWNDRGSASSWTGGLAGFSDLLSMHGQITRILGQENRIVVLGDQEVWQGSSVGYPNLFDFQPLDRNVGCPYPWTATVTPVGIFFLGTGLQVYWLPKTGGPAQPVGQKVIRLLRDNIDLPERSWGVYDSTFNQYQLYFPTQGSFYPKRALILNVSSLGEESGSWAPISFDAASKRVSLTRGFEAQIATSSGTTWGGAGSLTWATIPQTWAQMGGTSYGLAVHAGTSDGTMVYYNPSVTSEYFSASSTSGAVQNVAKWRSLAYTGFAPEREKTLREIRIDYQADSHSSLTLRTSADQGANFDGGVGVALPASSQQSQVRAFVYTSARYPCFQVESEHHNFRLYRFWVEMIAGGR